MSKRPIIMSVGRVAVAVSGGVDSSVALRLLHDAGRDVFGITMKHLPSELAGERVGSCCAPSSVAAAGRLCARLGVPHYVFDLEEDFTREVMAPSARSYANGRTPNPCVWCNERIKFSALARRAFSLGAQTVATGHYARIEDGKLFRARDQARDQSYFLYRVPHDVRNRLSLPLGEMTKEEVRERAHGWGLEMSDKPDSMDVCFALDGDFSFAFQRYAPEALAPGPVVDEAGSEIGTHDGIGRVTIGQRRGLRIPASKRLYVRSIDAATQTVTLGARPEITSFAIADAIFDDDVAQEFEGTARVRSQHAGVAAHVVRSGTTAAITLDHASTIVSPGQSAVFYDGDRVLGGGFIE